MPRTLRVSTAPKPRITAAPAAKRAVRKQAIGRSRGARTTKTHAIVDMKGGIIAFSLTEGNRHDLPPAQDLMEKLPAVMTLLSDAAYDSDWLWTFLTDREAMPEIRHNPTRKKLHPFNSTAYRGPNVIGRAFSLLKDGHRVATRYDKLARKFTATITPPAIVRWWV